MEALYYDGQSSRQVAVSISVDTPGRLQVSGPGVDASYALDAVRAGEASTFATCGSAQVPVMSY